MKLDYVYEELKKKKGPIAFKTIYNMLKKQKLIGQEEIGELYSELVLDRRFKSCPDNKWDLSERYKFSKSKSADIDILEADDDLSDKEEIKEKSNEKDEKEDDESDGEDEEYDDYN